MKTSSIVSYEKRRKAVPRAAIRSLCVIPGIGPSLAADLYLLGIRSVESLKGRDPEALYRKLSRILRQPVDRCVLYAFRCAVYFASEADPDPAKLKWWLWMDERDTRSSTGPRGSRAGESALRNKSTRPRRGTGVKAT